MVTPKKNVLSKSFLKGFIQQKFNLYFLIALLIILIGVSVCKRNYRDIRIFPNEPNLSYSFFTDSSSGGNSFISKSFISDSILNFEFFLKEGFATPYVGVTAEDKNTNSMNFGSANEIRLEAAVYGLENIGIYLYTKNPNSEKLKQGSQLCFYYGLPVEQNRTVYTIDLHKFKIPDWYSAVNGIHNSETIKPNLNQVLYVNVTTAYYSSNIEVQGVIRIFNMKFVSNNSTLNTILAGVGVLAFSVLVLLYFIKTQLAIKSVNVSIDYRPVELHDESSLAKSFLDFINNNFHDCDLTLDQVSKNTGVNQRRIASSILNNYGCNFKSYVNQIRINESKRLLQISDLSMGEIAFKVGFNNQSHFNRVFKNIEGLSPSEYRGINK